MAGIADLPLRRLWRAMGAAYTVGEMTTADPRLRGSAKTRSRLAADGGAAPTVIQLAGADPRMLAEAARYCVDLGAQVIDINMGCPAKKVCNAAAGSALLRDEALVLRIVESVVAAVPVPVTLKLRTGWSPHSRNAPRIARMAESAGVQMLTLHGRTRACGFGGHAEYDTIAEVKSLVRVPVVANGDIDSPGKAQQVLLRTGADAVMVGRAAHARPWIFSEIEHFLQRGRPAPPMRVEQARMLLLRHFDEHIAHHGEAAGVRTLRKRLHFLGRSLRGGRRLCERINFATHSGEQRSALEDFLRQAAARGPFFEYIDAVEAAAAQERLTDTVAHTTINDPV
jgi:tRNA-dihydrouridine synthase B